MMSMQKVVPPITGRACIGNAASPAATRTGPVRRSSTESAMPWVSSQNSPIDALPSRRGVPTGSSIQASSEKLARNASLSAAEKQPV